MNVDHRRVTPSSFVSQTKAGGTDSKNIINNKTGKDDHDKSNNNNNNAYNIKMLICYLNKKLIYFGLKVLWGRVGIVWQVSTAGYCSMFTSNLFSCLN